MIAPSTTGSVPLQRAPEVGDQPLRRRGGLHDPARVVDDEHARPAGPARPSSVRARALTAAARAPTASSGATPATMSASAGVNAAGPLSRYSAKVAQATPATTSAARSSCSTP